ncbi:protease modulator HflC [Paracoccus laeviglucosivorans]|uniref:Protease FtsH subunit HflC n=1 Tax=Paracoccus laeviglucosivorans TaxID=1197861 RepID=A0A521CBE0_9RHOB|nr:protease modulator HflC [Paracoccus laeviglucosivorans]SMO56718.1 protease FtsH subunit HflC [Paracoccus laeviglucosivorans]
MGRFISVLALPFLVVVAVVVMASVYIVDVRERVLVLRFGQVVEVRENPGIGLKVPFVDSIVRFDARILGLPTQPMEVTPLDDRRLVVDAFARWQVMDAQQLYQATEGRGLPRAQERLDSIINDVIRRVLGSVPSTMVLSDDRTQLMNRIRDGARAEAESLGVRIIDVRLTRTDLPEQNLDATYARMRAERQREAADEIARGNEAAQRVRAAADRTVVELTSEARKKSEIVRGEADARRNAIYASAFGRDPEFFAFTRSMTSYERSLKGENSSLIIKPEGEFFDYLRSDGAERANPVPVASSAAADVVTGAASTENGQQDVVPPSETNREGQPLGENAGVTLTPMPESLSSPPQDESAVPAPAPAN